MRQAITFFALLHSPPWRTEAFAGRFLPSFGFRKSRLFGRSPHSSAGSRSLSALSMTDVVDAEFSYDEMKDNTEHKRPKTLVDLSLDSAPEMKDVEVEFVEMMPSGNQKYIDCKLPFTVDLDGVTYAVGTPSDPVVAVITDENGETVMLDADDDSKVEIFQIAAAALVKYMGEDLRLKRTPRILTVEGDLNSYTAKWIQEERVATEDLLVHEDEDDQFFDQFFKDELGPNYEEEFLLDEQSDEEAKKAMEFFNVPGLGTEEDDEKGIQNMLQEIGEDLASGNDVSIMDNTKGLPLFPFKGPDDETYVLVQITQPVLLVGKEDPAIDEAQRLLLNAEESARILPQVRSEFRALMEKNGLLE